MIERTALMKRYAGLVHSVAGEVSRRSVGRPAGDLVGAGMLGLIRAIGTFEPGSTVAFSTFAARAIRAAISEELRSPPWMRPSARARARRLEVASTALRLRLRRAPKAEEMAAQLDVHPSTYQRWQDVAGRTSPAEKHSQLREAIGCLCRTDRVVLALACFERLTMSQIAELMHSSEEWVIEIHARAIARLRDCLEPRARPAAGVPTPGA